STATTSASTSRVSGCPACCGSDWRAISWAEARGRRAGPLEQLFPPRRHATIVIDAKQAPRIKEDEMAGLDVTALFEARGDGHYGEAVTQRDHALQCAGRATLAGVRALAGRPGRPASPRGSDGGGRASLVPRCAERPSLGRRGQGPAGEDTAAERMGAVAREIFRPADAAPRVKTIM